MKRCIVAVNVIVPNIIKIGYNIGSYMFVRVKMAEFTIKMHDTGADLHRGAVISPGSLRHQCFINVTCVLGKFCPNLRLAPSGRFTTNLNPNGEGRGRSTNLLFEQFY